MRFYKNTYPRISIYSGAGIQGTGIQGTNFNFFKKFVRWDTRNDFGIFGDFTVPCIPAPLYQFSAKSAYKNF